MPGGPIPVGPPPGLAARLLGRLRPDAPPSGRGGPSTYKMTWEQIVRPAGNGRELLRAGWGLVPFS